MRKEFAIIIGAFAAALLVAPPLMAAQDQGTQAQQEQASPSQEPAKQAKTEAVQPGAVNKMPEPGAKTVGNQQASPSQLPAPKATPGAVEAEKGKSESR